MWAARFRTAGAAGAFAAAAAGVLGTSRAASQGTTTATSSWWGSAASSALPAAPRRTAVTLPNQRSTFDVVVVGGGIVGLATARHIALQYPDKTVAVLEKESEIARHQTAHNSGVIHAGMYYKPGTAMAKCCVQGARMMYEYCEENNIPYSRCGKLICASTEEEMSKVQMLYERGVENGVEDLQVLDSKQIQEIEPNVKVFGALYSPNTGIVDYAVVARHFAEDLLATGRGEVRVCFEAREFEQTGDGLIQIRGGEVGQPGPVKSVKAKHVITCAGLYADRVSVAAGGETAPKVLPFRGTYYQLKEEYSDIVKMNIYPVPSDGGIPVGVHLTPTVNEERGRSIIIGPGACIAFSREGYRFWTAKVKDLWHIVTHPGLWAFAIKYPHLSIGELYKDLNKSAFLKEAQKLVPSITDDMVEPSFSGVMAQVFDYQGQAAADYILEEGSHGKILNVRSAPSPACTSSMAIAEHVTSVAEKQFGWEATKPAK
eukprot:m.486495 g.486495  ORF g.486495 m.486495 type:complete len:487 (+) comp24453_c0_seq1:171-1631(+)